MMYVPPRLFKNVWNVMICILEMYIMCASIEKQLDIVKDCVGGPGMTGEKGGGGRREYLILFFCFATVCFAPQGRTILQSGII